MSDNADKNSAAIRERRLERVKKLLNLSKSGNPNEAALAMNMAVRILQESGLTMEDVGLSEIKSVKLKKVLSSGFNRVPNYETRFLRLMEKAFGIKVIYSKDYGVKTYEFYGPGDRVDMGVYVCEVLVRQLSAARKRYLKEDCNFGNWSVFRTLKRDMADSYCSGWVSGVTDLVNTFVDITPEEQKLIEKFEKINYPNMGETKSRSGASWNAQGYNKGISDGRNATLNRPVNGSGARELLLGY